jgi:cell division protease FtsH
VPNTAKPEDKKQRRDRYGAMWLILAFGAPLALFFLPWRLSPPSQVVPYSQFQQWVDEGHVREVIIRETTIEGVLKTPLKDGVGAFSTVRVDPAIADRLAAHNIVVRAAQNEGWLLALISSLLPIVLLYGFWIWLSRRSSATSGLDGVLSVGKSKARIYGERDTKVTFADVEGVEEAKFELQEVVSFLKSPEQYGRLGAHIPKGILLVGPPGTGKTLLARAVAGEAGVAFFSISGSEFVEMFVGVGAARVRDLFEQARKAAPCIIFIDELDALGRSRANVALGGLDEKEQTLNQLLAELDGFDPRAGVILLAATNRPEILDPALLRAGRFDRQVLVDRPDHRGRAAILKVHARKVRLAASLDLDVVAGLTTGFTGADLANLVNEAAIVATRRDAQDVTLADFVVAIERIVAGAEKKSRLLRPEEKRRVAYHELGHALVAASLPGVDPVQKVSIIPRGVGALGYTMQRPTEDRFLLARSDLESRLAVLLGGRAAEQIIFEGDISTGAADDLDRATAVALDMVVRYGMSPQVGARTYAAAHELFLANTEQRPVAASETTAREIDVAVRDLIGAAETRARAILVSRRLDLDAGAQLLLKQETITVEEFAPLRQRAYAAPSLLPSPREDVA